MDILVFILFIAFMLLLRSVLLSVDASESKDDKHSLPTFTGRPRTCIQHSWIYNQQKQMLCNRCGHKPGELQ